MKEAVGLFICCPNRLIEEKFTVTPSNRPCVRLSHVRLWRYKMNRTRQMKHKIVWANTDCHRTTASRSFVLWCTTYLNPLILISLNGLFFLSFSFSLFLVFFYHFFCFYSFLIFWFRFFGRVLVIVVVVYRRRRVVVQVVLPNYQAFDNAFERLHAIRHINLVAFRSTTLPASVKVDVKDASGDGINHQLEVLCQTLGMRRIRRHHPHRFFMIIS